MIIFVGNELSGKDFVNTKRYKTLLDWIYKISINATEVCIYSERDEELLFWRQQQKSYTRRILFIALGSEAEKQLKKDGVSHYFKLPHPRELDKKLNDKDWLEEQLKLCKEWINEQKLRNNNR